MLRLALAGAVALAGGVWSTNNITATRAAAPPTRQQARAKRKWSFDIVFSLCITHPVFPTHREKVNVALFTWTV